MKFGVWGCSGSFGCCGVWFGDLVAAFVAAFVVACGDGFQLPVALVGFAFDGGACCLWYG